MLAGATQRSDSDPDDATNPLITVGPHWVIMWPFDPKITGLPTKHKPTGAYTKWARRTRMCTSGDVRKTISPSGRSMVMNRG